VVVDEQHFTGLCRQRQLALVGLLSIDDLSRDRAPEGRREARLVASIEHFDASSALRRVVQGRPDLQLRIPVEAPEAPAILVPRKVAAARGALGE
jgi:hypothetical protein